MARISAAELFVLTRRKSAVAAVAAAVDAVAAVAAAVVTRGPTED
jgi:hypothetical protein